MAAEAHEKWEGTAKKGHFSQLAVNLCILPLDSPSLKDASNSVVFNFCILREDHYCIRTYCDKCGLKIGKSENILLFSV